jgi:hypothetical protein
VRNSTQTATSCRKALPAATDGLTCVTASRGGIARFNYARHGEPDGVVLDMAGCLHTKPQVLVGPKLKVGDKESADGEAQSLEVVEDRVVKAVRVNGKRAKA